MLVRKLTTEAIGTFFLVLTIGCTVILSADAGKGIIPPLAIGSALMVMIFAGGHISGGHYNPAVTLAVAIRGRHPMGEVVPYWIAQIVGGLLAAGAALFLTGGVAEAAGPPPDIAKTLLAEFLFTFALAYVVLNVATAKATAGNSFYGLAIGFTVLTGAFSVGSVSGGPFNPAVAIAAGVMGLLHLPSIWIHIVADLAGGLVAGLAFLFLNPGDK
ncbi:MAG TPA: aquaporin [Pirellulales bacterium]|nr:aquaporin [Pirellulales bacterium]